MLKLIIGIVAIIFIKFALNTYKYRRIKHLSDLHTKWLARKDDTFPSHVKEAVDLIKQSGIPSTNANIPITESAGFGIIRSYNVSVINNLISYDARVASTVTALFNAAAGAYKKRALDAFNPFYWLDLVVFLPKHLLQYLGIDIEERIAFKATNVLLTFLWWLAGVAIIYFGPYIKEYVLTLIS